MRPAGRPPGAPRKAGQGQSMANGQSGPSSARAGEPTVSSSGQVSNQAPTNNTLFTMPRVPSERLAEERQGSGTNGDHQSGPSSSWLSRRPPGQHEHDQSSSAFVETPTSRQRQKATSSQQQMYTTPSLVRPSTSKLYQDLTRGIAAARRVKPDSRISIASSGWGSRRLSIGQEGRPVAASEASFRLDSGIAGPSALLQKLSPGVFDTPRTPSGQGGIFKQPHAFMGGANGSSLANPTNQDGSFSVVRSEEDANNSGLLGMSPAVRRINALGLGITPAYAQSNGEQHKSPSRINDAANSKSYGRTSFESASTKANQSIIEHSSLPDDGLENDEMEAMRARLLQVDGWDEPVSENRTALLEVMRNWREDAMKHHLYDTAIFWGDKILSLESECKKVTDERDDKVDL